MALFRCDEALNISQIDGDLANRLGCDSGELFGTLWRPFLHHEDWPVIDAMIAALASGHAGHYALKAVAKSGDRLHLTVRTLVVHGSDLATQIGGVIDLVECQSPRRYFDLK
jgi:hypothetical protein